MKALRIYTPWVERDLINEFLNSVPVNDSYDRSYCGCVPANIVENEKDFHIELSVPGYSKEEVKISIQKNVLTIQSVDHSEQDNKVKYLRREFGKTGFERKFNLSKYVDAEHITARFDNGILEITLPKKEEVLEKTPLEIEIQ